MLQRAASNAYSWWWASHIRTKQSKWLEHNLQDMEGKVQYVLKLINEDGDSFAKRAEMYYRKRPEILGFIEESYRAYRALAERYDHISGELQNANHTIATVFPEQVQFAIDEEEDQTSPKESPHCMEPSKVPKQLPEVPKVELPKLLKIPSKTIEGSPRRPPKKMLLKKISKITVVNSQMTKEEALAEIDRLQKRILTLQTEKEFIKSSYENRIAKYQEIETEIAGMQDKVSSLQDEFSVGVVIEDHVARTLMASTALRSCEETLAQLQATQGRSIEEARVEHQRIKGGHEKLESLKDELLHNKKNDNIDDKHATNAAASDLKVLKEEVGPPQKDRTESELLREKIREHFKVNSDSTFSVTELAEKIDELVTKVVTLETAVSSQTALIQRLRSQTDELLKHLHSLEADKEIVLKDSSKLSKRLRELEEELQEVQELNRNVEMQNDNLETHFTEAHCNLDHLSDKLKNVKDVDEESEVTGSELQEEASLVHPEPHDEYEESQKADVTKRGGRSEGEDKDEEVSSSSKDEDDLFDLHPTRSDNLIDLVPKEALDIVKQQEDQVEVEEELGVDNSSLEKPGKPQEQENSYEEDTPNWKELFLKGLDDREKILLQEYTSTLRKYKEAKKKLSETENKNRDSLIETMVQLRELKSSNAVKDEEIRSLRKNLTFLQATYAESFHRPNSEGSQLGRLGDKTDQSCSSPTGDRADESTTDKVANISLKEDNQEEVREVVVTEARTISPIEEKFRRDIDDLLEENLEFWLRFSTAFHQIQNFQTAVHDLQTEYSKLKDKKKQEGSATSTNVSQKSDARPIYKHLREIQTELTVWSEQNLLLKDELKHRLSSLNNIQEEISRVLKSESGTDDEAEFTSYQAAKFQGEILNMKQENNKVANELQSGLDHVNGLQLEIEKTLAKIDEDFKLSGSKTNSNNMMNSLSRTRIPLRSFLFGVKAKKTKPSLFSCMSPALQKQYSDLHGGNLPLQR